MEKYSQIDAAGFTRLSGENVNPLEVLSRQLGDKFDKYRDDWDRVNSFELETEFPISIDFETVSSCNLECVMCSLGYKKNNRRKMADFNLFKKIIDEAAGRLKSVLLNVLGEPLLHKQFMKFVDYAYNNGVVDIMLNTNGILLNKKITNQLLDSGLTRLHISIDASDSDTYLKIRGQDKYDLIRNNIEHFRLERDRRDKRLPLIRASFVKCKENIDQIEKFKREFRELVDFFSIQEFYNPMPDSDEALVHAPEIKKEFHDQCNQPWNRLVILSNGDVGPCCATGSIAQLKIGDANTQTIEEIWNSPKMKQLRSIHKRREYYKDPLCKVCLEQ